LRNSLFATDVKDAGAVRGTSLPSK